LRAYAPSNTNKPKGWQQAMADIHIDDFCRDAAQVILHLYSAFPRRASVYVADIAGEDEPDDVGLHSDRHMACLGTILWLAEEGYLRYEAMVYQDGVDQAVLSGRSFTLLSSLSQFRYAAPSPALPEAVAIEKMTLIEQIRAAVRSRESRKTTAIMRYFLSTPSSTATLPDVPTDNSLTESAPSDDVPPSNEQGCEDATTLNS
jgi:hypothetical protein